MGERSAARRRDPWARLGRRGLRLPGWEARPRPSTPREPGAASWVPSRPGSGRKAAGRPGLNAFPLPGLEPRPSAPGGGTGLGVGVKGGEERGLGGGDTF